MIFYYMFKNRQKIIIYCPFIIFLSIFCMILVISANAQTPTNNSRMDISGIYLSDKQTIYHIIQTNNSIWILGTDAPNFKSNTFVSIFSGTLENNNSKITGKWIGSPLSNDTALNGEHIIAKTYPRTTNPPGCGPPSQYVVKLFVTTHR